MEKVSINNKTEVMALENLISVSFTDEELQQADAHIAALKSLFEGKCITLTSNQRKEYGRMGDRTENWVKKVVDYTGNQPELTPQFISKEELDLDYKARQDLMSRWKQLDAVADLVDDTMLLLGFDLYNTARAYYKNVRMLTGQNVTGAKAVYEDLATQFEKKSRSSSEVV